MKTRTLLLSVFLGLSLVATPVFSDTAIEVVKDSNDRAVQKQFQSDMNKLVKAIKKDRKYNKIPLDSKVDRDWFTSQAFLYWDHKISRSEFVDQGL